MSSYFPYHKDEWEQILTQAFDPDAPDPPFSEAYQKRKQEMENTMLRKKPEKNASVFWAQQPSLVPWALLPQPRLLLPLWARASMNFSPTNRITPKTP